MILYALILRALDGMPLSATLETDGLPQITNIKRHIKVLGKKVKNLPDRCSVELGKLTLHFTTTLGVSYMVLCEMNYPVVLAFSFLDELIREFITVYTTKDVDTALRPYCFIQFDNNIQRTRHRYNNPSSLVTQINLSKLSREIKLHPPHHVSVKELDFLPINGTNASLISAVGVRPPPTTWLDFLVILITGFSGLFNFVRGISALSESSFEDYSGSNPWHAIAFMAETVTQVFQVMLKGRIHAVWVVIFLVLNFCRRHLLWTAISLFAICLCNLIVWEVRDLWQIMFHVTVASVITFRIVLRRPQKKSPNYNV